MERWSNGKQEGRDDGVMEYWSIGKTRTKAFLLNLF
jgi:hypothetical protein